LPSFPPGPDYSRTLSGIGPSTPEPPSARDAEFDSARLVELLRRISDHEERARVLLAEREVWRTEQRALRASGEELREKLVRLEEEARLAASEREALVRELSDARAEAARQEATAREQAELRMRLGDEHATTVAALTRRLAELTTELAGLRGLSARLVELERQGDRLAELGRQKLELEQALAAANERLREQEASGNRPSPGDDFTRIKGIGPTYDRALRAAGIQSFAEIASWTDDDVIRIAGVLRARPDRIRREDWIGSARRLLEGG
jgi:predicted flap endonuclease-1-like 5' DNA nuclease